MKVLHIHPSMNGGGIEAMICALANEMAEQGHEVTVCSIFKPTEEFVFWDKLNPSVKKTHLGKTKKGFDLKNVFQIFKFISKGNYDVVHIHGFFYYYIMSVFLLNKKVQFFYTVHNDAQMENSLWDQRLFFLKKWAFKHRLVNIVTISQTSEDSFKKLYGMPGHIIYNGVPRPIILGHDNPVDESRITPSTKVFINPGRISAQKNQEVLCEVFKRVIEEGNDVVLLIAGSNDDQEIYSRLTPYFSDRIKYLGLRSDIPELMAKADAFCLPSIFEGMPVTLLEAFSVGCVPICSPVGGIVNVVKDGENGILSDSYDVESYSKAIKRFLMMTNEEVSTLKSKCVDSFAPFDISNTAKSYVDYYKTVCK
ncbi:MAG: glycosyltransferase family 4 protein [Paludibacteraceae bacterium]|nr:glycosyltransferase family 4 protein [Paludibacteraceae bacterium]